MVLVVLVTVTVGKLVGELLGHLGPPALCYGLAGPQRIAEVQAAAGGQVEELVHMNLLSDGVVGDQLTHSVYRETLEIMEVHLLKISTSAKDKPKNLKHTDKIVATSRIWNTEKSLLFTMTTLGDRITSGQCLMQVETAKQGRGDREKNMTPNFKANVLALHL